MAVPRGSFSEVRWFGYPQVVQKHHFSQTSTSAKPFGWLTHLIPRSYDSRLAFMTKDAPSNGAS